ncbi:hypothetical protein XCR_2189 [Xanthomonas campestris pv. raphani 756C]|nr:hypothetical protein XCR_2189 [Xanthomonas campestris pv. raphani 756C]
MQSACQNRAGFLAPGFRAHQNPRSPCAAGVWRAPRAGACPRCATRSGPWARGNQA